MPKKEKRDLDFAFNRLEEILQGNHNSSKEFIAEAEKTINRSVSIASNANFIKKLSEYAGAIVETCNLSLKETNKISIVLMINMITLMLSRMEKDGYIKVNV